MPPEQAVSYFDLDAKEQADLLRQMEVELGVAAAILEKDIWLCLVLEKLFELPGKKPMVFKGGTSLSKVYKAINRFSEDIDVTIDWRSLRTDAPDKEAVTALSKTKKGQLSNQIKLQLEGHIEAIVLPELGDALRAVVPDITTSYETDDEGKEQKDKLRVSYPSVVENTIGYLKASVLLEFGARNPIEPGELHEISPDVASKFPEIKFPNAKVEVLSPHRTFWEKATLIHDECHRTTMRAEAKRMSRHWYDLARLADHEIGPRALQEPLIFESVLLAKQTFFAYNYSRYDLCSTGHFKLVPDGELIEALRVDYEAMASSKMFYGEHLDFDAIVLRLTALQLDINAQFAKPPLDSQA